MTGWCVRRNYVPSGSGDGSERKDGRESRRKWGYCRAEAEFLALERKLGPALSAEEQIGTMIVLS